MFTCSAASAAWALTPLTTIFMMAHLTKNLQLLAAGALVLAAVVPFISHSVRLVLDDAPLLRPDRRLVRLLVASALAVRISAEAFFANANRFSSFATEDFVSAFRICAALKKSIRLTA